MKKAPAKKVAPKKIAAKQRLKAGKPPASAVQKAKAILANRKRNSPTAVKWAQGILKR